jgi:DNA-binding transcriptional ArsR family regulator
MEAVLWQVLAGTRGGPNRARLLRAIDERPRNANQLAEALDLDYKTIRHHLDVLDENNVVRSTDMQYGAVWLPSDRTREHWETVAKILDQLDDVESIEASRESDPAEPPSTDGGTE